MRFDEELCLCGMAETLELFCVFLAASNLGSYDALKVVMTESLARICGLAGWTESLPCMLKHL